MSFDWSTDPALPDDVRARLGLQLGFDDQQQAESWLTASYLELVDAGVETVTLVEADRVVYGPMSLSE